MQRLDSLSIALPGGKAAPLEDTRPLTLSIEKDDHLRVAGQSVTLAQVAAAVHAKLRPDGKLIVAADDKATQGAVTRAMLEARRAGARELLIVIRHE